MRRHTQRMTMATAFLALASAALIPSMAAAQPGPAYNCLPTCEEDDARLLVIAAGPAFKTLSDPSLDLSFVVPAGATSFEIGIFDGDAIGIGGLRENWDSGSLSAPFSDPVFEYTIYADPLANVSGTEVIAGPFFDAAMPNDAWFDMGGPILTGPEAQAADGDYVYRLRIQLLNPDASQIANGFKVRSSEFATIRKIAQPFGYIAQLASLSDLYTVYPECGDPGDNDTDPLPPFTDVPPPSDSCYQTTTYDGTFEFFFDFPLGETELAVWGGDFDHGSAGSIGDTNDANTPDAPYEPPFASVDAVGEAAQGPGNPADDTSSPFFRRSPSVEWTLFAPGTPSSCVDDPASGCYFNENPSGNQEWELFLLNDQPVCPDPPALPVPGCSDYTATTPGGTWRLAIDGVDLANLNFLQLPSELLCVEERDPSTGVLVPCASTRVPVRVGDLVFLDLDGDGFPIAGEPGLPRVVVELLGPSGNVLDRKVTDASGNYSFPVQGEATSGVEYGVRVAPNNFGAPTPGLTLGNRVWLDVDGNGIDGDGDDGSGFEEPPLPNVTVDLFLDGGDGLTDGFDDTPLGSTSTDGNGVYQFQGLSPGNYWVRVQQASLPVNLTLTGGTDPSSIGTPSQSFDFGYGTDGVLAIVGNRVWSDASGDGLQDAGEAGIDSVTLVLICETAGGCTVGGASFMVGDPIREVRTIPGGGYLFTDLPAGDYSIDVTDTAGLLADYMLTTSNDPTSIFSLAAGQMLLDKDFGYVDAAKADIADRVWFDANRNGVFDAGDSPIPGVSVNLVKTLAATRCQTCSPTGTGRIIASATTDSAGFITFPDLENDTYTLVITDLSNELAGLIATTTGSARGTQTWVLEGVSVSEESFGWIAIGALEGLIGTTIKDPDADVNLQIDNVLEADILDYDFGYRGTGSIGDRVWSDLDGDGVQDGDEDGINGVTVELRDGSGTLLATAVTTGDGNYSFPNLPPGTYTVTVISPPGAQTFDLDGTLDNQTTVVLGAGEQRTDVDFGYDCLPDIDFESGSGGGQLHRGQIIDDEFAGYGITVTTNDPVNHPAMIFDSSAPTGGDHDLGTPNKDFGGPGIGSGGGAGQPGQNSVAQGKVLIISEDGDSSDPDDNGNGGTITFTFDGPVLLDSVDILDIDGPESMGMVTAYDGSGTQLASGVMQPLGDNSFQTVAVVAQGVRRLEVWFPASGGVSKIRFCPSPCTPRTVCDEFNRVSFSNNDGPDDWSGSWIEYDPVQGGAGPSAGHVRVRNNALKLFDYPNTGGEPSAAREVDLQGALSATLSFDFWTTSGVDTSDAIAVEVSSNGGASWTVLETITGIHGATTGSRSLDISGFLSAQTQVRFRVSNLYGGSSEYFYADNIQVRSSCEPFVPQPITVRDDFDVTSFSNDDGPDDWSGSWIENDPESGGSGPSAGQVRVKYGHLKLDDQPNTGGHPSAARQVNLAGTTQAFLSFLFRTTGGVDTSDAVTVEVSSNGGGSWTPLEVITGIHGATSQTRTFDITGFTSAQTQVRFRVTNLYGGSDEFFKVDWIEVSGN